MKQERLYSLSSPIVMYLYLVFSLSIFLYQNVLAKFDIKGLCNKYFQPNSRKNCICFFDFVGKSN